MKVYHMSPTLKVGDTLKADYQQNLSLIQPFVQALEHGYDCFLGMVLNAKYLFAVLNKSGLREWSDYAKWSTEGAFEFIRKTEFPNALSRLKCNYFYDDLANVKKLFEYDWGDEPEEEKRLIHLFEADLQQESVQKFDMNFFNQAYSAMEEKQDIGAVFSCARNYFNGKRSEFPVLEILTDKNVKIEKDVTELLY